MVIRDLNGEPNELMVFQQNDGDIQVTIRRNAEYYNDSIVLGVRIGSAGSGHFVPPKIIGLFRQLAEEFEKYKYCSTEEQAFERYAKEETVHEKR